MSLNHLLQVLSGSLNLVIMSITGSEFRKALYKVLGMQLETEEIGLRRGTTITENGRTEHMEMDSIRETQI